MIIIGEYIYSNIELNETRNIVENTLLEYEQKFGADYSRSVKVKCVAEFLVKTNTEIKNVIIERYNFIGELNKIMQSSGGMIKLIRIIELKIVIKKRLYKHVLDLDLKSENNPTLWKKFIMKTSNDRDNLYNRPKGYIQHCREKHFHNFNDCRSIN